MKFRLDGSFEINLLGFLVLVFIGLMVGMAIAGKIEWSFVLEKLEGLISLIKK